MNWKDLLPVAAMFVPALLLLIGAFVKLLVVALA
jgi:hypothetical protein